MPAAGRPRGAAAAASATTGKTTGAAQKAAPLAPETQPVDPPGLAIPPAGTAAAANQRPEPGEWRSGEAESSSDEGTRVVL
eukprot:161104-Lingulodinium_polyedra.AAC.1